MEDGGLESQVGYPWNDVLGELSDAENELKFTYMTPLLGTVPNFGFRHNCSCFFFHDLQPGELFTWRRLSS